MEVKQIKIFWYKREAKTKVVEGWSALGGRRLYSRGRGGANEGVLAEGLEGEASEEGEEAADGGVLAAVVDWHGDDEEHNVGHENS